MEDPIEKVQWNKYKQLFPDRYLDRSYFDDFKDRMVTENLDILDIGGGVDGSLSSSQAMKNNAWILDPFIYNTPIPRGYTGKISKIEDGGLYDLIIMRGSFNYLVPLEIMGLKKYLKPAGKIIFNTFINPSEIFRPYFINKKFTGYEKTTYIPDSTKENGVIWHYLIPEKGKIIEHRFFYYCHNWIKSLFNGMAIQNKKDKNTAIYVIQHTFEETKI